MKHTFTRDKYWNLYYKSPVNDKWILVVCKSPNRERANEFLKDNKDCSVLAVIGRLVLIAFKDDLGVATV